MLYYVPSVNYPQPMQKLLLSLFVSAILNAGSSSLSLLENKPSINIFKKNYNTLPNPKLIFSLAYKYNSVENHYNKLKNSFGTHGNLKTNVSNRVKEYLFVGK